jgi:DNA-nicking Smr family endonuclease
MCAKKYLDNFSNLDFSELTQDIKPLEQDKIVHSYKTERKAHNHSVKRKFDQLPSQVRFSDAYDPFPSEEEALNLEYRSHGVSLPMFKRMKKGKVPYSDSLDLHGQTKIEAKTLLTLMFDRWLSQGDQLVRITHGHGSGQLKKALNAWLRQDSDVLAFCPTPTRAYSSPSIFLLIKYYGQDGRDIQLLD